VTVEDGQPLFRDSARRHWEYVRETVRDGRDEVGVIGRLLNLYVDTLFGAISRGCNILWTRWLK